MLSQSTLLLAFGAALTVQALAAGEPAADRPMALGPPFWSISVMENEPLLFIKQAGAATATARLLFTPSAKLRLTHPDLVMQYAENKDYVWKPGTDIIELTATSRIPFKTAAEMLPPPGSPNTMLGKLFSEGHFFHDLQVQASYEHADKWEGPIPSAAAEKLTRSLTKLKAKQACKFVALGDSITEGGNASLIIKTPPYQPDYSALVANTLQARFGAPVSLVNLSVGGKRSEWGITQTDKVIAEKPDLVLVAFGMNDGAGPAFENNIRKIVETLRAGCPQADLILVAPMTFNYFPNPPDDPRFKGYLASLRRLEGPGLAVADVYNMWLELLKKKNFSDLSGNNINHPNDFGHRLYAQVVLQLFAPLPPAPPVSAPASGKPAPEKPLTLGTPFWSSAAMENEPLLFIKQDGAERATARLLFTPSGKLRLTHPDLVMKYVENKDYVWKPGTNIIELTAVSRIPFKTAADMAPPPWPCPPTVPNTMNGILFSGGHFFHDLQVQASYAHADKWQGPVPGAAAEKLARSLTKLKAKQPFKFAALGDSITDGSNCSLLDHVPPFQPNYVQLAANTLQERFGAPVQMVNFSQGGTRSEWGITQTGKVIAAQPDLVLVAFGMNDSAWPPHPEIYEGHIRQIVDNLRAGCPGADIILVAPMSSNPFPRPPDIDPRFKGYLASLRRLEGPGVAVADLYSMWMYLLQNKKNFSDLTGNNANHPNDFGHRMFAQIVLQLFGPASGEANDQKGK